MTLNHGFSGYVCGRVAMPLAERWSGVPARVLSWVMFLGAMAPDLDILGNLPGTGAYFSGAWYGHRMASHSILGTLGLALVGAVLLYPAGRRFTHAPPMRLLVGMGAAFWLGGLLHIAADLFTPGMPMPVFWPRGETYGALSHIGWFSPYLFWLFAATLALEGLLRFGGRWMGALYRPVVALAVWTVYAVAAWRTIQFVATSRYDSGPQWIAYHQQLLPDVLIGPVNGAVRSVWYFMTR